MADRTSINWSSKDLYVVTVGVLNAVTSARQALERCPVNEVSWQSIEHDLLDAADAAREMAKRCKMVR